MECKDGRLERHNIKLGDLIDTLWNVKGIENIGITRVATDLIDTLWNVKLKGFPIGRTKNGI